MLKGCKIARGLAAMGLALVMAASAANAQKLLIVHADVGSWASDAQTRLLGTGMFTNVDVFDANSATPLLGDLTGYDQVLAYTDFIPANPTGLGDVLADYVDAGGKVMVATYGMSSPWTLAGRIMTAGYNPLTNDGTNGDVSGTLNALMPLDPIFTGVTLGAVSYFHNSNFAHSGLDGGAILLADDGAGINMIARNADCNVMGFNLFPGGGTIGNNDEFYKLLGNSLLNIHCTDIPDVPEPGTVAFLIGGLAGMAGLLRASRRSK